MATPVFIVACKVAPSLSATTLASQCPVASRVTLQTTREFIEQQSTPAPEPLQLDAASVSSVFAIAFSTIVLCYLVARGFGSVLRLIRFG